MIYRFRIILDTKEDIFRDLEIEPSASLEDFHYAIAQSLGFGGQEMASFYTTNENWESEFIDRTVAKNKDKPLRKLLDLRNIGFYCKPGDATVRMTSLIPSKLE